MDLISPILIKDIIRLGCFPCKSLILKFPTSNQVPENLMKHFIRGYFDGDGSVSMSNKRLNFYFLGTYDMCYNIRKFLNKFLNFPENQTIETKGKIFKLAYSGNPKSKIFYHFIYKDANLFLKRKYDIFNKLNTSITLSKRELSIFSLLNINN